MSASAFAILGKPVTNDRPRCAAVNAPYDDEYTPKLQILSTRTDEMLADCMTKALTPHKHLAACMLLWPRGSSPRERAQARNVVPLPSSFWGKVPTIMVPIYQKVGPGGAQLESIRYLAVFSTAGVL